MTIQEAIKKATGGSHLSREESRSVFEEIMSGKATQAQIAAIIIALHMKGETIEEITGAAEVMREKATPVIPDSADHIVDTCGTGGDSSHTFNISTAAAFVAAAAGARVAKHGNRSVSSKCGSADVLEALGVNIAIEPKKMKACLDEIGICFLFAPALHGAMKHAIGPRKEIGIRTIFNVLGPLTNPAGAKNQLMGVFMPELTEPLARVLRNMGSDHAYVVHGFNRMDEISITGETRISELSDGLIKTFTISPEDYDLPGASPEAVRGGGAAENADIIKKIFSGEKGPHRDIVIFNAGFAIAAAGVATDPAEGIQKAAEALDSGAVEEKLALLVEKTS
jgi:anthranilate phosphoribosyltransferase